MTRADKVVVFLAVALLPYLYLNYWSNGSGETARILVPGQAEIVVPLDEERNLVVDGPLGSSTIEVHDGKVRFVDSPCQKRLCVLSGWLQRNGAFAACLPNRVSLLVAGTELQFDAINF